MNKRIVFEFRAGSPPDHLFMDKAGTFTEHQLEIILVAIGYEMELAKKRATIDPWESPAYIGGGDV